MKKLAALLFVIVSLFNNVSTAQNTGTCNAEFNIAYLTGNTVQFNPVMPGEPNSMHYWLFGDGAVNNTVSPAHTYNAPGSYTAKHILIRFNPNGVEICRDSFSRVVQINIPCNLVANFVSTIISTAPFTYHFENTSTPINNIDSVRWTFGDGTSSNQVSPNHTYAQPGTYNVCLRIQQFSSASTVPCIREICHTIVVQGTQTCNLVVNFYSYRDSLSTNPYTYHFQNTSVPLNNSDSIRWTFGDGTSSNQVSPNHTYAQPGTYTVCLRIQKREPNGGLTNCIREYCRTIIVQNPTACNLVVNFYSYRDSLSPNPYTYHFQNTSVPLNNSDSIRWTFGDGTSSNQVSPNHTYAQPGTYTVCLRIQKTNTAGTPVCVREICHTVVVLYITTCNLTADFYSYRDSLSTIPNTFHFENTSTPLSNTDSIRWTFGDGTSSNQVSPNHSYAQPGTYTVCLRVQKRNSNGVLSNCIREICRPVTVPASCNIQAHFTWHADSLNNRKIYFTNLTNSPNAAAAATWFFGDGTTSTAWNPVHDYAQPGTYNVCLRVQISPSCISYYCDSVRINASLPNCNQQSQFTFIRATGNNQLYYFTPNAINNNWQYTWTFGDGTGSQSITASHQYAVPGNYTACLTVFRNANCASTTCKPIQVAYQVNCDTVHVSFNYQRDPVINNKLYFHTISNFPVVNQTWTITRLPAAAGTAPVTLHQNNPTYVFNDTGYYRVCLRAVTSGGCVKEYCQVIHISQVTTPTNCSLQVYPNPVTGTFNMNLFLTQPQMIDVYIYNSLNVLVKQKHQQGFTGTNIVTIPVADLVAGTYTVRVIHGNAICYAQFVKL